MELFRRAVRRAGGRLALSAGMRPKTLLSLALPLAVGMKADAELCEFDLAAVPPLDFADRLAAALPAGLRVVALEPYLEPRHAAARVVAVAYDVDVESEAGVDLRSVLEEAAGQFAALPELIMQERREDRVRTLDLKAYVQRVDVHAGASETAGPRAAVLGFRVAVTPTGSARPERVVEAFAQLAGVKLTMRGGRRRRIELA
jgi:radical SAM-linked protein